MEKPITFDCPTCRVKAGWRCRVRIPHGWDIADDFHDARKELANPARRYSGVQLPLLPIKDRP